MNDEKRKLRLIEDLAERIVELRSIPGFWAEERNALGYMLDITAEMLRNEHIRLGYVSVYPICNGCSCEAIFTGTPSDCRTYVQSIRNSDPEFDCIIT